METDRGWRLARQFVTMEGANIEVCWYMITQIFGQILKGTLP